MNNSLKKVLVTGGAGYVGAQLVPLLLKEGYKVVVLDLYLYGEDVLERVRGNPNLLEIKGDIRDITAVRQAIKGCDAVIHLACVSNDPSFELDPELGKSINYDCFPALVDAAKEAGVKRFIYASSSSVYGIKKEKNVTEDLELKPLTDYSKYKALCEEILLKKREPGFEVVILRPATVCGYSPRLRLDLTVNILTAYAVEKGFIRVFGGEQMRPNININDMCRLYLESLKWPAKLVDGEIFNAGYQNLKVIEIAEIVRNVVGKKVEIRVEPTDDIRSYHISSEKIRRICGFTPKWSVADAVRDLKDAFNSGLVPKPFEDNRYSNIKTMQSAGLSAVPCFLGASTVSYNVL